MKKLVRRNRSYIRMSDIPEYRLIIDIEFELIEDAVAASIQSASGSWLTGAAKSDFDEFLINAYEVFRDCAFTVIFEKPSKNKGSLSKYYTLIRQSETTGDSIKVVVFIRLSDHGLDMDDERVKARSKYHESEAQRMKKPSEKSHQRWKFKSIAVDGEHYLNYEDALEGLEKYLRNIKK